MVTLIEVFGQIVAGQCFTAPGSLLRVSSARANAVLAPMPYSLATNVAHAVLWQDFWLAKLAGGRKRSSLVEWQNDFRVSEPEEWPFLRERFLAGLGEAKAIADRGSNDPETIETLVTIAVHASYHIGQMNLLKRAAR